MVVPCFVDVHMHGAGGFDVGTCDLDGLSGICKMLARHGTGAFLPTLPSATPEVTRRALSVISRKIKNQRELFDFVLGCSDAFSGIKVDEALVLGAHLEGPFFLSAYKGAQDESTFMDATIENWKMLVGDHEDVVRRVTIDPLVNGALELIKYLSDKGITVSCGHTAADAELIYKAFKAGATSVTHIFNGMPPMHHRAPGPVGAALSHDDSYAELICDFLHVNKLVCKTVVKAKGTDKVAIITDSCEAAGMPDGPYKLCGSDVYVVNGEARTPEGKLASSTVFMDIERQNLLSLGFGERDVTRLTHTTPLECMRASVAEKKALSKLFALIGDNGLADGLTVIS